VLVPDQAIQDILDDDDDIAAMYLTRKATLKARAATDASEGHTVACDKQDDVVLVSEAAVCVLSHS